MTKIKPTILVVDDEAKFTDTFVSFLNATFNAEVILKTHAKDAIEVINSRKVDVLFQDIHLANGPNGFEVVKHTRESGKDIIIFIISKWQDNEVYSKQMIELKVKYVPKPISLFTIKTALEEEFETRGTFDYKKNPK